MGPHKGTLTMLSLRLHIDQLDLQWETEDSFDDLIVKQHYRNGPMPKLDELRSHTPDNAAVRVEIAGAQPETDQQRENLERIFLKAGFVAAVYDNTGDAPEVRAVKRPSYYVEYDYGMVLQEFTDDYDIIRGHQFAEKIYYYKDFYYDYDVARQFDPNADVFAVVNQRNDILALGRSILRLPGYNCPFMHAEDGKGSHVKVPQKYTHICEVMGVYLEGREGIIAFKKLMEVLTQYAYYIAQVDSIWTTYDEEDAYTGTYYRRKLLMTEAGPKLLYRDFGGLWNLIFTDRIRELKDVHENMFDR